ncbi:MAG: UbiH/UbiF/VisC/COQ6 family ubiquinone biosynthesis hydroxylase [Gammaproteobacteria bacterium]|nr:UbiH/UbiF/VisC/COQ6 family ubiquinone biosynthesis hydroxylase [Gammaproteobacteria bacterium]
MSESYDIVIIGAGMVGASAALALAQNGLKIALVEYQKPTEFNLNDEIELRVSAISASSEQLLSQLGAWSIIQNQRLSPYHKMTVWDENSNGVLAFDSANQAQSHLGHIIENKLIMYALQQQIKNNKNINCYWENGISQLKEEPNSINITLNNGQYCQAKLLIAADGRASHTRQMLDIPLISKSYQQQAIVANVNTELAHQNTAWQRFLSTGPLAFLPLNNQQSSVVWSCKNEIAEQLMTLDEQHFCQELGNAFEFKLGKVISSSNRASFPLSWQYAAQYVKNRCILIGDAAHGIHPLAGQGVNLGFSDVALLSQSIQQTMLDNPHKTLKKYERQRKHDSLISLHSMSVINALFTSKSPVINTLKGMGMNFINQQQSLKNTITRSAANNISV